MKTLGIAAACLALALLTFFQFPGHTWLQQDSQIYTAIMERLDDASALRHDILAAKPHVAYTLYDETTLALAFLTRFDLRTVLAVEQVAARALGIWGLYLMAMGWAGSGLPRFTRVHALCVAAVCSLGATVAGPTVLTVEYEATPRAFALPLVLCAIGLTAHGRFVAAGVAAAAAFLFHPPTALPFWILFIVVACWPGKPAIIVRRLGGMAPLAGAVVILTIFAHRQEGAGEAQAFFTRLTPFLERLQRWRASYNWISTWPPGVIGHYVILFGVLLAAFARIRREIGLELRVFLLGLPALGMLSMPASWLLLDRFRWALLPQYQPMRCLLFVTLFAQFLTAVAGVRAALRRQAAEAVVWFAAAFLVTLQPVWTEAYEPRRLILGAALAAAAWLAHREAAHRAAPLAVTLAAFFLVPGLGHVANYPRLHTPELQQLAAWARTSTPKDSVFLFPDAGKAVEPGIFRAEAVRAVYVDWKGGGQVNYLEGFAEQWWFRWEQTLASRFRPAAVGRYEGLGIQYIVLRRRNRLPQAPVFENEAYLVYRAPFRR